MRDLASRLVRNAAGGIGKMAGLPWRARARIARWRSPIAGLVVVTLAAALGATTVPTTAQTGGVTAPAPAVPSVRILKGVPITPATASAHYTSSTATDGLCRDFGPAGVHAAVAGICPSGGRPRDPEVVELARALRNDPDLIYEYVRNRIDTEFLFGSHKGALGVIIDGSGTPFDQARLLSELLRQAGYSTSYRFGTATLTGGQFAEWTGLTQAKAACEFLATAGIPATVNGSSPANCAISGSVSSVSFSHVWVQVQIGGQAVFMDPSIKSYVHQTTLPTLHADMGFSAGAAGTAARSGMTQGTASAQAYVSNLNSSGLSAQLNARSAALLARVRENPGTGERDLRGGDIAEVVGGRRITAATRPAGGWRLSQPASYTAQTTWTNIPDVLRARLTVQATRPYQTSTVTVFPAIEFFVDEIYGRRLEIGSVQRPCSTQPDPGCELSAYAPQLLLDGVPLLTAGSVTEYALIPLDVTLSANHPFAAQSGTYADATVQKKAEFLSSMAIVHGWGETSVELANKWAREQGVDRERFATHEMTDTGPARTSDGDLLRARIAAAWLAQFSRAREIHAELANSRQVHLHSLGLVSAAQTRAYTLQPHATDAGEPIPDLPDGFDVAEESVVVDVETSFGLIHRAGIVAARRAALHAIAATGATLEGSVLEQLTMTPDAASTARRLAWGNAPEAGESPSVASRRVYRYQGASTSQVTATLVSENLASGVHPAFTPSGGATQAPLPSSVPGRMIGRLSGTISNYLALGYDVIASNEAMLGPGHRHGAEVLVNVSAGGIDPISEPAYVYERAASLQVGGAIVANHYDGNGDPDFIAHTLTRYGAISKGAGTGVGHPGSFDSTRPADALKDSWVDRSAALGIDLSSGTASYTSPVLSSIGQGEFPHMLESRIELRGGGLGRFPNADTQYPEYGRDEVVSNWEVVASLGSSGMQAMGDGRLEAAVQTIVAFTAMQDVWLETPSASRETIGLLIADWWGRTINHNTVTVSKGAAAAQYVRAADGRYLAPSGAARVELSGSPQAERPYAHYVGRFPEDSSQREALERVWNMSAVQIRAFGSHGDVQRFQAIGVDPVSAHGPLFASGPKRKLWTFRLADWTFPEGVVLTPSYASADRGVTPTHISSSLGYQLPLPAIQTTNCSNSACREAANAIGGIHRVQFTAPRSRTLTERPIANALPAAIYSARSTSTAAISYTYDTVGRIKESRDAIAVATPAARGAHQFFVADGYRGERQDPLGGRYAVETLNDGRLVRHIDEMGRVSTAVLDGRGRVASRTSAWGDVSTFEYDDRDNVTKLTRSPRADCGTSVHWCQTSVVSATYHATWNKPLTVTLPATIDGQTAGVWHYAYNSKGLVETVTSPAVYNAVNGATQPAVWQTFYDGFGRVSATIDPTGIRQNRQYGGYSQPAWCLTRIVDSAQVGGELLETEFTCNAKGDVLSQTDQRDNVTTFTWDALRRKTGEYGPASTAIKAEWTYDGDGNPLTERRWDSGASVWRTTTTTYSLTGKPLTVADPAGDLTRICYNAVDQATVEVDPTGRATRTSYNLAGQPTLVERWFETNVASAACALTNTRPAGITTNRWRGFEYNSGGLQSAEIDGNGNRTELTYDGLGRLMRTTYADGKFVQTHRNQRDQVWRTIKRGGDEHQAHYDQLGRIYQVREYDAGTSWPVGRAVRTAYDLAGRVRSTDVSTQTSAVFDNAALRDIRTYGYDAAGRVTQDRVQPNNGTMGTSQLVLTYGYDDAGNRTSITWPDGYKATYRFDAANRTDRVQFGPASNPTQHQADIAVDSLSRRTGLSRSNGANTTYAYETDSDLAQLSHAWAASAGQTAATFGYQHDAAGRITLTTSSRPDLEWMPTLAEATSYGVPTNLNQMTSAGGVTLQWDDNGNLRQAGADVFYDWTYGNRLWRVRKPGSTTEYAYDGQDRRTFVIEDGLMIRTLWSGDDEVGEYFHNGALSRRFIPDGSGAMDARLASVMASGSVFWFHANHQSSVVAMSNGAGAPGGMVNYSPHGEFGTTAAGLALTAPPANSPFGYTGRQWDAKAGLYHYRARYYDPALSVFLSMDPIGTKDDPNLYMYVRNDPVNLTDPTGMEAPCITFQTGCWGRPDDPETAGRESRAGLAMFVVATGAASALAPETLLLRAGVGLASRAAFAAGARLGIRYSNNVVRGYYIARAREIPASARAAGGTAEQQAMRAFNTRRAVREEARAAMRPADRRALDAAEPRHGNFEDLVARYTSRGQSREQAMESIIGASGRTSERYNTPEALRWAERFKK